MNNPTIRRTQARASLRENRIQPTRTRRQRSYSPESRPASASSMNQPIGGPSTVNTQNVRKRKKQPLTSLTAPTISSANHSRHNQNYDQVPDDDQNMAQPQSRWAKSKSKVLGSGVERGRHPLNINGKKEKDRSMSREPWNNKRNVSPDAIEADDESTGGYTGPLAIAEFSRLKVEVEKLKEQLHYSKRTIHKQSRVIDELRQEATTANKHNKEQSAQLEKLKTKSRQSEELIGNIEASLQCQICLDTLQKPFTLSPCGHVLCQGCLQSWFRTPPANEDEMYDEDDPNALLHRRKSCPSCRSSVRTRPIPLFIVKSIAAAFNKTQISESNPQPSPPPETADPWAGIFPEQDETMSSSDEDDDDDDDDGSYGWAAYDVQGYGSDSDEEMYQGEYVPARWQPPTVHIDPEDYTYHDLEAEDFKMLRRGATVQMIQLFNMQYSHREGLSVFVDDINRVFIGWNITLRGDDDTGEEYIDYIVNDIFDRPDRWEREDDEDEGSWMAWKLVPVDEDERFDTTDSEAWMNDEGDDESE